MTSELLKDFYQAFLNVDRNDTEQIAKLNKQYEDWVNRDFVERYKEVIYYNNADLQAFAEDFTYDEDLTIQDIEFSNTLFKELILNLSAEDYKEIHNYFIMEVPDNTLYREALENICYRKLSDPYLVAQLKAGCDMKGIQSYWRRIEDE